MARVCEFEAYARTNWVHHQVTSQGAKQDRLVRVATRTRMRMRRRRLQEMVVVVVVEEEELARTG